MNSSVGDQVVVLNPYDGSHVGAVPNHSANDARDILRRLEGGQSAFDPELSRQALDGLAKRIDASTPDLAALITRESGLCLKDTLLELDRVQDCIRAALQVLDARALTKSWPFSGGELRIVKEAVDLVYAITPFNHPLLQVCHKVLPALVVGTPILLKPCEKTPLTAVWLADTLRRLGIPENLFQCATTVPVSVWTPGGPVAERASCASEVSDGSTTTQQAGVEADRSGVAAVRVA